nr:hypothetical protein [Tanacetum cinerariifolium]
MDRGLDSGFNCCSSGSDGGGDGGEESEESNESNLATVSKEEESGSLGEGGTEKPVSILSRKEQVEKKKLRIACVSSNLRDVAQRTQPLQRLFIITARNAPAGNQTRLRGFYEFQSNWKQETRRIQVRRNIDNPRSNEEFCLKMVRTPIQLMRTLDKMPEEGNLEMNKNCNQKALKNIRTSACGIQEYQLQEKNQLFIKVLPKKSGGSCHHTSGNRSVVHDTVNNIRGKSSSYIR